MTRLISASRPMTGSSLPSLADLVRSTPNFSSALYVSSGSWLVTRALPRIWPNASSSASGVAPAAASRALASPPSAARPTSRCSVEMYSSFSALARLDAVAIVGQQRAGHLRRAQRGAAGAGEPGQPLLGLLGDQRRVGADRAEQRGGGPVLLL